MSHVFGPVPSRRLGRSLGVDVVPFKICTYDCLYCQLGRTTCRTVERAEWVPLDEVVAEVETKLSTAPDVITLSGSGEPTLYSRTGELIEHIKGMTDIPVAVLTNGSLLWRADVRGELLAADLVIPSLDAGDEAMFETVNRPHADIAFDAMLEGLVAFGGEFGGKYWLEVFLLSGLTGTEAEVSKLASCAARIGSDRVQLNTVTRPPAEETAAAVPAERMAALARLFDPPAEVIVDVPRVHQQAEFAAGREDILSMLRRRPCSVEDIANGLGMHPNEVVKYIETLRSSGRIVESRVGGKTYYRAPT
ncbi:MAG TPA: radical SAM protein [Planctomycetota bacterium]|nr:radical SAM protein [Planctomycetota bacterium]